MSSFDSQQQRYQSLLDQRAQIDAEIQIFDQTLPTLRSTRITSVPTIQYVQPPINNSGRRDLPRTYSGAESSIGRNLSTDQTHRGSTELSRNFSQPLTSSMARRGSLVLPSASSSRPPRNNVQPGPSLHAINTQMTTSTIDPWVSQDGPFNTYTLSHQPYPQLDVGEDPAEYFSRNEIGVPTSHTNRVGLHHQTSSSSRHSYQSPPTPGSATLTTATTLPSEMSRQSSYCNEALESFQMMQVHSNVSAYSEVEPNNEAYFSGGNAFLSSSCPKRLSSNEEQNMLLAGAGSGIGHGLSFSLSQAAAVPVPYQSSIPSTEIMERSQSAESISSNSSSESRSKRQLQKTNQLAARKLAPKAGGDGRSMPRNASQPKMVRIKSSDGMGDRVAVQIEKAPYQRPKHDRVFCHFCNEIPQGFRGAHELGRHTDRQHKNLVKKYICIEPVDGVNYSKYKPVTPISKCKACTLQKKTYGIYYNAAAHLRRAHFVPKQRGRGKSHKADEKLEKRGGKGGGDWPPMDELKRWMKAVWVKVDIKPPQQDDDDNEDELMGSGCDDDYLTSMEKPTNNIAQAIDTTIPNNFDNSLIYDDAPMYDAYTTSPSTYSEQSIQSMQNMQHMQFDLPLQRGVDVDISMPFDSIQSSYDQTVLMDDNMAFIGETQIAQNYEDPSLGSDFLHTFSF